jgi:hypothetical protein
LGLRLALFRSVILSAALWAVAALAQQPPPQQQQAAPAPSPAPGIPITLKDGKVVQALGLRRDGRNLMAKITLPGGAPGAAQVTGEVGYPVASVAGVGFPEPPQIKRAAELAGAGKAAEALTAIGPVVAEFAPFKDVPGSWWAQAAAIKLNALVALDQDAPAEALGEELLKSGADPEQVLTARSYLAAKWAQKGDCRRAVPVLDEIVEKSKSPEALAAAWVGKGRCLLEGGDADAAALAFLRVPVYFADQKQHLPAAILGSARAYERLGETARAIRSLEELAAQFPDCPEIGEAKQMLAKLQKNPTTPQ